MTFGARLDAAMDAHGPLCVGIDPHPPLLERWGLGVDLDGLARFTDACVEAFAGQVAVVKPQSAFFEAFGAAGSAVLERAVQALRSAGTLVLLDVKRGDIGSTMAAYAAAYLDPASPFAADAMTVSPFLGVGSLEPAFDTAARHGAGVFVLARTSNPEGASVQNAVTPSGPTVAESIVADIAARNAGAEPYGSFGLVVGATITDRLQLGELRGPVLMPGVGAQGGTAADVARLVGEHRRGVLPSVSREVLSHGPDPAALRAAAGSLADQFRFLR
ncbi:orotidine-5'-phosphate decarboxylase [Jatrophihabitans sp. YIM 134969]